MARKAPAWALYAIATDGLANSHAVAITVFGEDHDGLSPLERLTWPLVKCYLDVLGPLIEPEPGWEDSLERDSGYVEVLEELNDHFSALVNDNRRAPNKQELADAAKMLYEQFNDEPTSWCQIPTGPTQLDRGNYEDRRKWLLHEWHLALIAACRQFVDIYDKVVRKAKDLPVDTILFCTDWHLPDVLRPLSIEPVPGKTLAACTALEACAARGAGWKGYRLAGCRVDKATLDAFVKFMKTGEFDDHQAIEAIKLLGIAEEVAA